MTDMDAAELGKLVRDVFTAAGVVNPHQFSAKSVMAAADILNDRFARSYEKGRQAGLEEQADNLRMMRTALQFYADPRSWQRLTSEDTKHMSMAFDDAGMRARVATGLYDAWLKDKPEGGQ